MSSSDFEFPSKFARGLTEEAWAEKSPPYRSAFLFDPDDPANPRDDGYRELSVTWLCDPESVNVLMSTHRKGSPMFIAGVGIVRRAIVDDMRSRYGSEKISYEHRPSKKNPHHGNILIGKCSIVEERNIAARLAMSAKFYKYDEDIPWHEQT